MAVKRGSFDRLTMIFLGVFVVLAIVTGVVVFHVARDIFKSWTSTPLTGVAISNPTADATMEGTPIPGDIPLQAVGPTPDPWDGKNRVTVLVMGLDYRDWEGGGPSRTDTMILLTIDPVTNTAGILSIPRDLWVNIPGYGYAKINQAYYFGELNNLPGGGPALAVETVKEFLGVDINYYAQIDFSAFEKFIDELDGVKLDIPEEITVYTIGGDKAIKLEPGRVTLPGNIALAYARNRETAGSDFDRAKRQQQVIMAVRDRILSFDMLPKLITRAPAIYNELSSGISTNMTLDEASKLGWLAIQLPKENITQAQIGVNEVEFAKSPDGLDILIPLPDKIRLVRDQIFASGTPVGPAAVSQDLSTLVTDEAARISVQNGSGQDGMAGQTSDWLKSQGLNVVDESNADGVYDTTTFYVYNGKPYTLRYLAQIMGIENPRVYNRYDPTSAYDIAVVVGRDWSVP
jgi:LCP family protein required for cell wall assembly